ncbi:hypothetical protein [Nostoc sp.]
MRNETQHQESLIFIGFHYNPNGAIESNLIGAIALLCLLLRRGK